MSEDTDVLGIYWWYAKDGTKHYRSRGFGRKYDRLYGWIYKTSYECIGEDFPWDYWIFTNPNDHDTMCLMFGDDVWHDESSDELTQEGI